MKKKTVTKKQVSPKKAGASVAAAAGAGLAAIAAAAGAYFLYGSKHAAKNRRQVKAWALKARGEVLEQIEKLPDINEKTYQKAIKDVAARYKALHRLNTKDVAEFTNELKSHWNDIAKEVARAAAPVLRKKAKAKKK